MLGYIKFIYENTLHFLLEVIPNSFWYIWNYWVLELFTNNPISMWIFLQIIIIAILVLCYRLFRLSKFWVIFEYLVESIYKFFEEILEESWKLWIKTYVVTLFFIILLSNLSAWILDWVRMIFVDVEALNNLIVIPTTTFEFNIALATMSVLLMLYVQFYETWFGKTLLEYFPITWKNIITIEKWNMNNLIYYPAKFIVKIVDIIISLFVGFLDIVGIWAKVISLSARLYWNMIAGWVLLTIVFISLNESTQSLLGFSFPIGLPLLLYAQWLLVALIQAFVFPLLVWIFMKLAQETEE